MVKYDIKCLRCGTKLPSKKWFWKHEEDNGTLTIAYKDVESYRFKDVLNTEFIDIRRYANLLPIRLKTLNMAPISPTPIVKRRIRGVNAFFKLEYLLPSGSFKDRGALISIAKVKELRIKSIIEDSSGNAGIAFTLFSSIYGMQANIFIPKDAPEGKKRMLKALGANVYEVEGSREKVNYEAREYERKGYGVYVGHWWNPFFIEGIKTIAFELHEQIGISNVDAIIVPTSSGGLLLGIYKGVVELKKMGEIPKLPRLIAVQASGYARLCYELGYGMGVEYSKLADGLRINNPPRIGEMVLAVKETKGTCYYVTDDEIKKSLKKLWSMGFTIEPTSAVTFSALLKALSERVIEKESNVVIVLTGSGLKMLDKILSLIT